MKIGIYNPYFDSYGGGERYTLTLAEHWSLLHDVSVLWNNKSMLNKAEERFSLDLDRVHVTPNFFSSGTLFNKLIESRRYDLLFILSDGSIPVSMAKCNILHFQVPFPRIRLPVWKTFNYQHVVCNSEFTRKNLDPSIQIPTSVIYPPVDTEAFTYDRKTKTILSVGRFDKGFGAKKHGILIDVFRKGVENRDLTDWKLIIAGSVPPRNEDYLKMLKKKAEGLPVLFYPDYPFSELRRLYAKASFYWHAAGFSETAPQNMEHFGITTVEAMVSGAIPLVFDGGGQSDIVFDNRNGFLWKTKDELLVKTCMLIKQPEKYKIIAEQARKTAETYSKKQFVESFDRLLHDICKQ
jgi:glycosyltransferase involved in cell wall biosynthesis